MLPSCFCQRHLMLFWIPCLTVTSHSPGWGEQLLCGFLRLLSLEPFNLAGSFPWKTRLHSNALSLVPRALTATCWKHLPLTLTCYEVERSLNQSPGKKACWNSETLVMGTAVGSSCMPLWTGKCRSTCLARAFAALPWNRSCTEPAISHPNERGFWMQRGLQCQDQRTVTWQVSQSERGWSELWAAKPKHTCTPLRSRLASPNRGLSAVKAILVCWHVLTSPSGIHGACLLLHLRGRGPTEPAVCCLGPRHAGRSQGLCHNFRRLSDENPSNLLTGGC